MHLMSVALLLMDADVDGGPYVIVSAANVFVNATAFALATALRRRNESVEMKVKKVFVGQRSQHGKHALMNERRQ